MCDDEVAVLLIHFGPGQCKAGFAGDNAPRAVFPSIVGRPRQQGVMVGMGQKDSYVGDEVQSNRGILTLKYPIEHGIVTNWDDLEMLANRMIHDKLRIDPKNYHLILTSKPNQTSIQKERLLALFLKKKGFKGVQFVDMSRLIQAGSHSNDGVYLHCGYGVSSIATFVDNTFIPQSDLIYELGGKDVEHKLKDLLIRNGNRFETSLEADYVRKLLETKGRVSSCESAEINSFKHTIGNHECVIKGEHIECFDILFDMSLIGKDAIGLQNMVHNSIGKASVFDTKTLYKNIYLTGKLSLQKGFVEKLQKLVHSKHNHIKEVRCTLLDIDKSLMAGVKKLIQEKFSDWITLESQGNLIGS